MIVEFRLDCPNKGVFILMQISVCKADVNIIIEKFKGNISKQIKIRQLCPNSQHMGLNRPMFKPPEGLARRF